MTGLDEPTDPDAGGPARQRLRELRGQIERVTRWQTDSPPFERRIGVSISRAWEKAVISAAEACRLASFMEAEDPESAAKLLEVASEVKRVAALSRSDPGNEIDETDATPTEIALARRLLGLDQPEA